MKYPEALYEKGLAATKPKVYAQGLLALMSMKPRDFTEGLKMITSDKIRKIAMANPKMAPYGIAAQEVLDKSGLYAVVKPKLVFGESVGQTLSYAMRATDVGFVAMSSLYSPKLRQLKQGQEWIAIEPALYSPIKQGVVLLKKGEKSSGAKAFYDFMLGEKARVILKAYGYQLP
jgi:molybdate transport system substrate-binding protein